MLEVVFGDSAAGSLSVAMGKGKHIGGATSVVILGDEDEKQRITDEEIRESLRKAEERERLNWEQAEPLESTRKDIMKFSLALNVGRIDEAGIGRERECALRMLMRAYPEEGEQVVKSFLQDSQKSLRELLARAAEGEPVRIWTSDSPDEACGIFWLAEQLRPLDLKKLQVIRVKLPDFHLEAEGTVVSCRGWGEMSPHQWGRMAKRGETLPPEYLLALSLHWRRLQKENAPLRAVISGTLVSVPESFYDPFLQWELDRQEQEFQEARVIGRVLGQAPIGVGDTWFALRIEQMIRDGLLEPVTQPKPGDPAYHRILRKCAGK